MNIHEAINQAKTELCGIGIGKDRRNDHQNYNFRGIDDIYNVIGPLLTKYKITLSPMVQEVHHETYPRQNGITHHYIVKVVYVAVCMEEPETAINIAVFGEGADTQDKGMNKAMTSAFKNCVFQTFMPPLSSTPLDMDSVTNTMPVDSEQDAPEMQSKPEKRPENPADIRPDQHRQLDELCNLSANAAAIRNGICKKFQVANFGKMNSKQYIEALTFLTNKITESGVDVGDLSMEPIV